MLQLAQKKIHDESQASASETNNILYANYLNLKKKVLKKSMCSIFIDNLEC